MKLVVTSTGKTMDSAVDPRFGRAGNFILFDTDTQAHQVLDNRAGVDAAHGAGIQAAEQVAKLGAQVVITGRCGPKAERSLRAAGIEIVVGAAGTVADVIARFRSGELATARTRDHETE
jgi:predicted Fe-Mo cluster-binding NifX family protein